MRRLDWHSFLASIQNVELFTLCRDFERLSLDDNTGESSSSNHTEEPSSSTNQVQPSSYGSITRFLRSWRHTPWNTSIIENLRAPFIEFPRCYMDALSSRAHNLTMSFGFRFLPGQYEFLLNELKLPESFDRLSFIKDTLGLSYTCIPPFFDSMLGYTSSGRGLRSFITDIEKTLVEVITYCNGNYGRFLVLVSIGIGCTVWYGFEPGSFNSAPTGEVFSRFNTYSQFFDAQYQAPAFSKLSFIERNDVSESVANALGNEQPFAEITIPASGNLLKSVGLGVMVAFFLSLGIVPNAINQ